MKTAQTPKEFIQEFYMGKIKHIPKDLDNYYYILEGSLDELNKDFISKEQHNKELKKVTEEWWMERNVKEEEILKLEKENTNLSNSLDQYKEKFEKVNILIEKLMKDRDELKKDIKIKNRIINDNTKLLLKRLEEIKKLKRGLPLE